MFYSFNSGAGNYDFIYDDTDKSVELVELEKLRKLGVEIAGTIDWKRVTYKDSIYGRLEMLGFREYEGYNIRYLELDICKWSFPDTEFKMYIHVVAGKDCSRISLNVLTGNKICVLNKFGRTKLKVVSLGDILKMYIPLEMVLYILNLRTKQDFNGLMRCFNNFFGSDIDKIIVDFGSTEITVVDWNM